MATILGTFNQLLLILNIYVRYGRIIQKKKDY